MVVSKKPDIRVTKTAKTKILTEEHYIEVSRPSVSILADTYSTISIAGIGKAHSKGFLSGFGEIERTKRLFGRIQNFNLLSTFNVKVGVPAEKTNRLHQMTLRGLY